MPLGTPSIDLPPSQSFGAWPSICSEDDDGPLKSLVELAENMPKYLRPGVDRLIPFSIKVIADMEIADNWRQLVLELVVTLCESAPAMIRKKVHGNRN